MISRESSSESKESPNMLHEIQEKIETIRRLTHANAKGIQTGYHMRRRSKYAAAADSYRIDSRSFREPAGGFKGGLPLTSRSKS